MCNSVKKQKEYMSRYFANVMYSLWCHMGHFFVLAYNYYNIPINLLKRFLCFDFCKLTK